ncbi:MAG: hypothetical protein COA57_06600 [Flavobacteriales bacterium]|nr:hypothetical protein [Bacteroidales bacterium AH-315-I05]PCJ86183.1 MAG: hypothetical protein COA57_06600 [Flavobacteriales bacterium]
MLQIKEIIQRLNEDDYSSIAENLEKNKAEKYHSLLSLYRENNHTDGEIINRLGVTSNAFYVLKSRLHEKIQQHLLDNMDAPRTEIIRKIVSIPNLIYENDRNFALAILYKLEKDLIDYDMPGELTAVYRALKKLHLHSDKYYHYSQLYNKHVAYTLAIDKAEDLLAEFNKKIGEYYVTRNEELLEIFPLIKKEMENICRLNQSHHLEVYLNLVNASIAIILDLPEAVKDDPPVEDLLDKTEEIISKYPKDINYTHLNKVNHFLAFEYYHKLKLDKKASQYFELINGEIPNFLHCNHLCFSSKLLISKLEHYIRFEKEKELCAQNEVLFEKHEPEKSDVPNYINWVKYVAASAYYADDYKKCTNLLSDLLNEIGFKHYAHSEIEIKLFLALTYSLCNKYDLAWRTLTSCSRKIREMNKNMSYENAVFFAKMLRLQTSTHPKNIEEKLIGLKNNFELINQGNKRMLEFIKMDDSFIKKLAKSVK